MNGSVGARPVSVVLVDDHLVFLQSLARLLADRPEVNVVALASSGAGALDAVARHRPDVVVLDHELPDTAGTDVAAEIVAAHLDTRVLMLTASESSDVLVAAVRAGCSGYVTKLSTIDEVVAAVLAAHAGEAVMPPDVLARLIPQFGREENSRRPRLSKREMEVLDLMAQGLSNQAIAENLYVSNYTARNHVRNILAKLKARSRLEGVSIAVRSGLIRFPPLQDP